MPKRWTSLNRAEAPAEPAGAARPARHRAPWRLRRRVAFACAAATAAACTAIAAAADDAAVLAPFSRAAPGEPPPPWRFAGLPRKQPTRFEIAADADGARVLKVEADGSYGNLVHGLHATAGERSVLAWKWRVDQLVDGADLKTQGGDDAAAKLCVFFAFDAGKLSLGERAKLAIGRSISGEDAPAETLCYVWDNKIAVGTVLPNAFTRRIRYIVLESGSARLARWQDEKRNLVADYRRVFGDESDTVPEIVGIAVSADADNTRGHGLAFFGDIDLRP